MTEIQDRDDGCYRCEICERLCNRDEISLQNEFDLDLCDDCLEGQRELDAQEEKEIDFDWLRDSREEISEDIRKFQNLERR